MREKVVILGLDGGTWSVLDKFVAAGLMPNLARLIESGRRAQLMSTVPPITPVAWSSMVTGTNPGKHGVFGFLSQRDDPGSYSPPPVSSVTVSAPTMWRIASDAGLRSVILSVPLTYPAEPVSGYMVTGMFTPGSVPGSTHPPDLLSRLEALGSVPKFQLDFTRRRERGRGDSVLRRALANGAAEYFRDLDETQDRLVAATRELTREPWDLLMAVLIGPDRLQHVLWDEVDSFSDGDDSLLSRNIACFYRRVDEAIWEFSRLAGERGHLMLVSDHGFGPCAGRFAVARWLVEEGYSVYRPRRLYGAARSAADRLGVRRLVRKAADTKGVSRVIRSESVPLDWTRTRAYFAAGTYGIRVNLRGRESRGIVEPGKEFEELRADIVERALAVTDPGSGRGIFSYARPAEDVYEGPHVRWAPDVVLGPNPELGCALIAGDPGSPRLLLPSPKSKGSHRPEGMFLIAGPRVSRSERVGRAEIADIAPTVLRLLGVRAPAWMDGHVPAEAFDSLPDQGGRPAPESGEGDDRDHSYSDGERDEIRKRLRNLGYID